MQLSNGVDRCRFFHFVFIGVLHVEEFEASVGHRYLEGCRVGNFVQVVELVGVASELIEEGGEFRTTTAARVSFGAKKIEPLAGLLR